MVVWAVIMIRLRLQRGYVPSSRIHIIYNNSPSESIARTHVQPENVSFLSFFPFLPSSPPPSPSSNYPHEERSFSTLPTYDLRFFSIFESFSIEIKSTLVIPLPPSTSPNFSFAFPDFSTESRMKRGQRGERRQKFRNSEERRL